MKSIAKLLNWKNHKKALGKPKGLAKTRLSGWILEEKSLLSTSDGSENLCCISTRLSTCFAVVPNSDPLKTKSFDVACTSAKTVRSVASKLLTLRWHYFDNLQALEIELIFIMQHDMDSCNFSLNELDVHVCSKRQKDVLKHITHAKTLWKEVLLKVWWLWELVGGNALPTCMALAFAKPPNFPWWNPHFLNLSNIKLFFNSPIYMFGERFVDCLPS